MKDIFTLDFTFPLAVVNGVALAFSLGELAVVDDQRNELTLCMRHQVGTIVLIVIPTPYLAILIPPLAGLYILTLKFYLVCSPRTIRESLTRLTVI
jgi:hypothetical protein